MCDDCWLEHKIALTDDARHAASLVVALYDENTGGGGLHVVVDGFDVSDTMLQRCYCDGDITTDGEHACLEAFLPMSEDERATALALAHGMWHGVAHIKDVAPEHLQAYRDDPRDSPICKFGTVYGGSA